MKAIVNSLAGYLVALLLGMPVWAMPISDADRVMVNGTTWAQADLFFRLTWNDINAQCPNGVCTSSSSLLGRDMAGWTWAGPDEVTALFNYYLGNAGVGGTDLLDSANLDDAYIEIAPFHASWINAVSQDFRYTSYDHSGSYYLQGWVAKFPGERYAMVSQYNGIEINFENRASSSSFASTHPDRVEYGAWFYCTDNCPASQPVSTPPVLPLVALALVGLGMSRRKFKLHC